MSLTLFELQRIWDAWPSIRNQHVLRDLFRRLSPDFTSEELRVSQVFVVPGHVFVAVSSKDGVLPKSRAALYVFSCAPLNEHPKSQGSHMTTTCLLELSQQCTEVLSVLSIGKDSQPQVLVVQNTGEVWTYRCHLPSHNWSLDETCQLSLSSTVLVHSCCFTSLPHSTRPSSRIFLYCARTFSSSSSSSSYVHQILLRRCEMAPNGSFNMGQSSILLESCPPLDFVAFKDGVCFLPCQGPYPNGLLLFWAPGAGDSVLNVRGYVWNLSAPTPFPPPPSYPINFKSVVLNMAGVWSKVSAEPGLVSIATHPVTEQLLALDNVGGVHSLELSITGTIKRRLLVTLSDPPCLSLSLFPSSSSTTSSTTSSTKPLLFVFYTHYGITFHGDVRLYDSFSGEFLWECNEHEGAGFKFWTMECSPGCCGIFGNSGIWIIRSQKVSDHAHFMARSLFPVKTNADETTPGEYLKEGQLIAARLCKIWGLPLLATKYALESIFDAVKNEDGSQKENFSTEDIPLELISLLAGSGSMQNPALLIALLTDFPLYRPDLTRRVASFLEDYHGNTPTECVNDLLTPLNRELVPLMEKYVELSQEMDSLLRRKDLKNDQIPWKLPRCLYGQLETLAVEDGCLTSTMRASVCDLLRRSEHCNLHCNELLRSKFHLLCYHHPEDALLGIRDFLGVESFQKAVEELKSGDWESQRQWKDIFSSEVAVCVERSYLKATVDRTPLFEETCRLLYHTSPEELPTFVMFAHLARDYQVGGDSAFARKCRSNFFYHRAVNSLPVFVSVEATPTKPEAIRVYCHLLLNSDLLNSEVMALKLLLANKMWVDAIQLVEKTQSEDSQCFLFHCLLTWLSKGGVLGQYINRVWVLLPPKFNVFDFLDILKWNESFSDSFLVPEGSSDLTVSDVAPKLKDLLQQSSSTLALL